MIGLLISLVCEKIERELTIVFPDLGGPEYLAVQPPVCSHSYLHVAASDPEKSQSISSIPLDSNFVKKEEEEWFTSNREE